MTAQLMLASGERLQRHTAGADPVGQGAARQLDAGAGVDGLLPIQRQVIGIFGDQHMRQRRLGRHASHTKLFVIHVRPPPSLAARLGPKHVRPDPPASDLMTSCGKFSMLGILKILLRTSRTELPPRPLTTTEPLSRTGPPSDMSRLSGLPENCRLPERRQRHTAAGIQAMRRKRP